MTKRRGRGEGSIYQLADGTWRGIIDLGRSAQGRRRRKWVRANTKAKALEEMRRLSLDPLLANVDAKRYTLGEYLDHWLQSRGDELRDTTRLCYSKIINKRLKPHVETIKLDTLRSVQVRALFSALEKEGYSRRGRAMAYEVLHAALETATKDGLIRSNPCAVITKPRREKRQPTVWDVEQCLAFFQAAKSDRYHALYVLGAAIGPRVGELLGLEWRDIDLRSGRIAFARQLVEVKGKPPYTRDLKTAASARTVALPAIALDALKEHRKRMLAEGHIGAPVFCNSEGGFVHRSNLRNRSWLPIIKKAGVPRIRLHDLRHSFATMLLEKGVHPKIAATVLGHSTTRTTLETYSHVLPGVDRVAADAVDAAFQKGSQKAAAERSEP